MPFGPRDLIDLDCDLSELRKIPGIPGYYINRHGQVFTVRLLKPFRDKQGYARVNSGRLRKAVHWLLAKVFLPPPRTDQKEVRHLDGNPQNNSLDNLAWGTRAENAADMARHGTVKGSNNPRAMLSESEVIEICKLLDNGCKQNEIAAKYKVNKATITAISSGQNWSHITGRKNTAA
ncbi:MAG TPA: HNH endonuclease [Candidatus Binatia bacterium]|nr:HNH endonuclease [Candidatus Binatia bacterium]